MTPTQPRPAAPPLILIIPQSTLETMPTHLAVGIRGCEAQYHAGTWFVTVTSDVYGQWPKERQPTP
jgi:hypothetical protein